MKHIESLETRRFLSAQVVYYNPTVGNDCSVGTISAPLRTLEAAKVRAKQEHAEIKEEKP